MSWYKKYEPPERHRPDIGLLIFLAVGLGELVIIVLAILSKFVEVV